MTKVKRSQISPTCVRYTIEERTRLEEIAHRLGFSLSQYIREVTLEKHQICRRRKAKKPPTVDQETAARLLAELKRTRFANNFNQLSKSVNSGLLFLPEEERDILRAACAHIAHMRELLLKALGL